MILMMAAAAIAAAMAQADDPIRAAVLKAIGSYAGIAGLVVALVGGLKLMMHDRIKGKEPLLALGATYIVGILAKLALPAVYGPHTIESWALHVLALLVVVVGVKGLHDGVVNALRKKAAPADGSEGGSP